MSFLSLNNLVPLAVDSLRAPRPTFARLLQVPVTQTTLWQALILVVVLSILLAGLTAAIAPQPAVPQDAPAGPTLSPFLFGAMQFALFAGMAWLIDVVGRKFDGTGDFNGALLAVVWLQFVMVCLQLLQSAVILLIPALLPAVTLLGLVLFLWLLTNFIAELHGFASLGRVFGMILMCLLGVALGLSFIATLMGVTLSQ